MTTGKNNIPGVIQHKAPAAEKQYKYNFCGFSTDKLTNETKNIFIERYDNILIKKYPFKVSLETKEIDVYTYIEVTDISEYIEDDNKYIVTLGIIPSFDSLTKDHKEDILYQFSDDNQEYILQHKEQLLNDMLNYGFYIPLHSTTVEPDMLEYTINSAMAVHHCIERLIGFDLNKTINEIGHTGWDFLSDYCEGVDLMKLAMDRYNQ